MKVEPNYLNRDVHRSTEEIAKDKAVRKLVRTIIEKTRGDMEATKRNITAKYSQGLVFYKGIKVGAYTDGKMELIGDGITLKAKFDELMAH